MDLRLRESVSDIVRALQSTTDANTRWRLAARLGRIRKRYKNRETYYIDLRPYGSVWSYKGFPLRASEDAERLLAEIQSKVSRTGVGIAEVLAEYQPSHAKPNLVVERLQTWLELKREQVRSGDRSPTYLGELEHGSGSSHPRAPRSSASAVSYGPLPQLRDPSRERRRHLLGDQHFRGIGAFDRGRWNERDGQRHRGRR